LLPDISGKKMAAKARSAQGIEQGAKEQGRARKLQITSARPMIIAE
jgi:hypothetical protein